MFSPGDFQSAGDFSGCDRESLFRWIRECVFNDSTWPHYRRLFKLAEQILDEEFLTEVYLRIDREPLAGAKVPSARTIGYFKRRTRRFLRKLLDSDPLSYNAIALNILARSGDNEHSLPKHYWLTHDLVFGSLVKSGHPKTREIAPTSASVRCRVKQGRHGRGDYVLLSLRPTLCVKQDALLAECDGAIERFSEIAESASLPWQTLEAAAIRLHLHSRKPRFSVPLLQAYGQSPSPLLRRIASDHLLAPETDCGSVSPRLFAVILYLSNGRRRRSLIDRLRRSNLSIDWRTQFSEFIWDTLTAAVDEHRLSPRLIGSVQVLLEIATDCSPIGTPGSIVRILEVAAREQIPTLARLLAKTACHLPGTPEFLLPFLNCRLLWINCVGWWLVRERVPDPITRGMIWSELLSDPDRSTSRAFNDTVAVSTALESVAARHAIVDFLSKNSATAISILAADNTCCREFAVSGLQNIKVVDRETLASLSWELTGTNLTVAVYALLDGAVSRHYLKWIFEELATWYDPNVRRVFWEWCCEARNREWLENHLHEVVETVWGDAVETISSSRQISLSLTLAGVFNTQAWWLDSLFDGLKESVNDATPRELTQLMHALPDENWGSYEELLSQRLADDPECAASFWDQLFDRAREAQILVTRVLGSADLLSSLATLDNPSFLQQDEKTVVPLVEHWVKHNDARLDSEHLHCIRNTERALSLAETSRKGKSP